MFRCRQLPCLCPFPAVPQLACGLAATLLCPSRPLQLAHNPAADWKPLPASSHLQHSTSDARRSTAGAEDAVGSTSKACCDCVCLLLPGGQARCSHPCEAASTVHVLVCRPPPCLNPMCRPKCAQPHPRGCPRCLCLSAVAPARAHKGPSCTTTNISWGCSNCLQASLLL